MSDTESENYEDIDEQMAFVLLLEDNKVLFDKRQTPAIKSQKEKASADVAAAFYKNTKKAITSKQVNNTLFLLYDNHMSTFYVERKG